MSRKLLKDVHSAFGGDLHALLVGGAFTEPATIEFFHDLGIPIYNGYGCTEACTAITLNDLTPFRPDTVGDRCRGMEIRIAQPGFGWNRRSGCAQQNGDVALPGRSGNDGGDARRWLADDRRPGTRGFRRPFAALRPQEEHDRHSRGQKYLS